MSILRTRMNAPAALLFALALTMALPIISFAQGRGNGQGRGPGSKLDKKCAKFVNCHDARDGRLDGRGPGVTQIGQQSDVDIFRNRRDRDRDDEVFYPRSRNRRIDRDGDGDVDRDDEILARRERNRRVDRDGDGDIDRDDWRRGRDRERIEGRERRARRDGRFDSND